MKNIKLIAFTVALLLIGNATIAQNYMDDIAKKSCECLNNIPANANKDEYTVKLGLCMIEAAMPYQKQLKKDHDIDFAKIDKQGEKLGRIIALRMASVCPNELVKLAADYNADEQKETSTKETPTKDNQISEIFEGTIVQIEDNQFVLFAVKNEEGKVVKFYWLTFPPSNIDLPSKYKSLLNKKVRISFSTNEVFDPKIGEYRTINVISKIDTIN